MKRKANSSSRHVTHTTQRNHSLDHEIDKRNETPEVKLRRRQAIKDIQAESLRKEWEIRRSGGAFSVPEHGYPKVIFAPAKLTKRGEDSE